MRRPYAVKRSNVPSYCRRRCYSEDLYNYGRRILRSGSARLYRYPGLQRPRRLLHRKVQLFLPARVDHRHNPGPPDWTTHQSCTFLARQFFEKEIQFSDELFFALLLPPIVFSVGYTIKTSHFFNNLGSIVVLGVFSTLISVTLFTLILTLVDKQFLSDRLTLKDILLLAIAVSASDPIAALPLIRVAVITTRITTPNSMPLSVGRASSTAQSPSFSSEPSPPKCQQHLTLSSTSGLIQLVGHLEGYVEFRLSTDLQFSGWPSDWACAQPHFQEGGVIYAIPDQINQPHPT